MQMFNEYVDDNLSLFTDIYEHTATLKHIAYNNIYAGNSLNVCICLMTKLMDLIDDR